MNRLEKLLKDAYKKSKNEEGTVADLGAVPTGHIINDKDLIDDDEEENK